MPSHLRATAYRGRVKNILDTIFFTPDVFAAQITVTPREGAYSTKESDGAYPGGIKRV